MDSSESCRDRILTALMGLAGVPNELIGQECLDTAGSILHHRIGDNEPRKAAKRLSARSRIPTRASQSRQLKREAEFAHSVRFPIVFVSGGGVCIEGLPQRFSTLGNLYGHLLREANRGAAESVAVMLRAKDPTAHTLPTQPQ